MNSTETAAAEARLEELLADTATDPEIVLLPHSKAIAAVALRMARALREHDCMGTIALDSDAIEGCNRCSALADWDTMLQSMGAAR